MIKVSPKMELNLHRINHMTNHKLEVAWSSGMISASGAGDPRFDSWCYPLLLIKKLKLSIQYILFGTIFLENIEFTLKLNLFEIIRPL